MLKRETERMGASFDQLYYREIIYLIHQDEGLSWIKSPQTFNPSKDVTISEEVRLLSYMLYRGSHCDWKCL